MSVCQQKLKEIPGRNRVSLARWFDEFSGSMHIEDWTPEAWGDFVSLSIGAGISASTIAEAVCVNVEDVQAWRTGRVLPDQPVRNATLRFVGNELS